MNYEYASDVDLPARGIVSERVIRAAAAHARSRRDFHAFAAELPEPLATVVHLHAVAADGNSPDVTDWVNSTIRESRLLRRDGIRTADAAEAWWIARYSPARL